MYKSNFKKNILILLIILILGALLCPSILFSSFDKTAQAEVYYDNYIFENYDVKIEVTDKNEYIVEENFIVRYGDPTDGLHKGIVRAIPLSTKIDKKVNGKKFSRSYDLKYSAVDANELYDYYTYEDWLYIELGGDDYINMTESVNRNYTVKYTLKFGDDFHDDYDFFFYNIIGSDYPVEINNITFKVTLPYDFEEVPTYYTGKHSSTELADVGQNKTVLSDGRVVLTGSFAKLLPNEALSIDLTLNEGYFEGLKEIISLRKTLDVVIVILSYVIAGVILIFAITINNKKRRPVETIEFYPPIDTTPVDAAYLLKGKTTAQDMMSLIVYWASKGLVRIELDEKKEPVKVVKLQNITEQAPDYEKSIFNEMFEYVNTFSLKVHNASLAQKVNESHTLVRVHNGELTSSKSKKIKLALGFVAVLAILAAVVIEALRVPVLMDFIIMECFFVFLSAAAIVILKHIILDLKHWHKYIIPVVVIGFILFIFIYSGIISLYCKLWIKLISFLPLLVFISSTKLIMEYDEKVIEKVGKLKGFKKNLELVDEQKLKKLIDEDPEYFYHILPYAYAMGIADNFIEKFENIAVYENENFGGLITIGYIHHMYMVSQHIAPPRSSGGFGGIGGGGGGAGGGAGGGGSRGR